WQAVRGHCRRPRTPGVRPVMGASTNHLGESVLEIRAEQRTREGLDDGAEVEAESVGMNLPSKPSQTCPKSRHPACSCVLVALFLVTPILSEATTIVIVRSSNYVVMAADSRVTASNGRTQINMTACKITEAGNVYFAGAGIFGDNDFNFNQIAIEAASSSRLIRRIADDFRARAIGPLTELARRIKKEQPEYFHKCCEKQHALQVGFIGR